MLQNSGSQSCALYRVGAGAQLVKENQTVGLDTVNNPDNILHVGRKGGEALFDALLVANVGKNIFIDRHHAGVCRRNEEPRLSHQAE